jgi:hypothetical protein
MIDPNWARWVFASVSKFFEEHRGHTKMFVEGTDMKGRREDEDYFEFRFNGPIIDEVSKEWYFLFFDVNILVCSLQDQKNFHRLHNSVGRASTMFDKVIPIYKYGDGPDDDGSLIDCAYLITEGGNGGIYINHHGKFDPTLNVLQSTVEGSYRLTIAL